MTHGSIIEEFPQEPPIPLYERIILAGAVLIAGAFLLSWMAYDRVKGWFE